MKESARKWFEDFAKKMGYSAAELAALQPDIEAYCAERPWFPEQMLDPDTLEKLKRDPTGRT